MTKQNIFSILIFTFFIFTNSFAQKVGEKAPNFIGTNFEEQEIKLEDFKDKVVLIDFWASWCSPCRKEMPFLVELHEKFKDKNFEIIAINIDQKESKAKSFLKKLETKPSFPMIWDKDSKIPPKYELETMPTTYLIGKNGNIRFIHKGFKDSYKEEFLKELEVLLNEK
ncbi:MAG: TlpA family protein disulfide reductase [Calditrichaeota bacterium]|nr:MAG: TlpA family protein disulfide reductase [Calditrichota bacterium]